MQSLLYQISVLLYLWLIKPILKCCIVSKYYFHDSMLHQIKSIIIFSEIVTENKTMNKNLELVSRSLKYTQTNVIAEYQELLVIQFLVINPLTYR